MHSVLDRTFYSQIGIGAEVFDARLGWWLIGYNRRRLRALGKKFPPDTMLPKVSLCLFICKCMYTVSVGALLLCTHEYVCLLYWNRIIIFMSPYVYRFVSTIQPSACVLIFWTGRLLREALRKSSR